MVSATIASPTMLPSLTDDAIFEILSWVPVKPACRLRCVSRAWRALISSPAFLTTHKSRVEPLLLSVTTSSPPEFNSTLRLMDIDGNIIRVIEKPGFWTIKDSSHGPVCVCIANYDVSVIDLATLNVVRTSAELNHESFCSLNVGCAIPSRKYKVVCLMSKHDPCKILTLEDGAKWRQVKSAPTPPLLTNGYNLGSAVTLNGVMHFLYKVATPQVDDYYVLGFDLESEFNKPMPHMGPD
nr:F-box/kelch-repeat protein At3g23880-like [Lolium perenne]